MRPQTLGTYTPAATSANGLANDVTSTGAAYTLAATTPDDSLAHIITILGNAATNHSAKTFTVVGTDAEGNAQTEGISGPNGVATVSTTKYFKTVTSVTPSASTGSDTFDIGWTAVAVSPCLVLDFVANPFSCGLMTDISGTINYTVQHTLQSPFDALPAALTWISNASPMASATADQSSNYTVPVAATRLLINSVTATATIKYTVLQARGN